MNFAHRLRRAKKLSVRRQAKLLAKPKVSCSHPRFYTKSDYKEKTLEFCEKCGMARHINNGKL